jgi:Uncharacterised nucleotidyltransferase
MVDHYSLHRSALAPLLPDAPEGSLQASCEFAVTTDETAFLRFLLQQGLAPLWDEKISQYDDTLPLSQDTLAGLHQSRLQATGNYLIQHNSLLRVTEILNAANIAHVITKGCHSRELYYDTPALRPAVDIDILVAPEDKINPIKAFQKQGYTFHGVAQNISHECSLIKGKTSVDLHWDILRPGRTRKPVVADLLATRRNFNSHWGMSHGANLFMMLVHPVFTKYSTTPHASLVRLVDLVQLLRSHPESTAEATELLHISGLATAGWITLSWLQILTGNPQAEALASAIEPGKLRRKYLLDWLFKNNSTHLLQKPTWVQVGFTLPAHDTLKDAVSAVRQARRCRQSANATLAAMQKQVSSTA